VPVYRLTIEYDGEGFSGWQVQPGRRTVQGALAAAATTVFGRPVGIRGASRTDAGVHALGQVASFEHPEEIDVSKLVRAVPALAGEDVAVVEAAEAPEGFDARRDAVGKRYLYRILARRAPSPLERRTSAHVPFDLDLDAMRRAAETLVGTHDFRGFRASDCGRSDTVRTLSEVVVTEGERGLVTVSVVGDAFLKNMVRIIAGTLIDVGRSALSEEAVGAALASGDRTAAGRTAPARGLFLVRVLYPDERIGVKEKKRGAADGSAAPGRSGP